MYCSGFLIDDKLYIIGGLSLNGKVLGDFKEIDLTKNVGKTPKVESGWDLLTQVYCSQICGVFYQSRLSRNLSTKCEQVRIKELTSKLNWGIQTDFIKHEGFYMFGGRLSDNSATNKLLLFTLHYDSIKEVTSFKITKPKTLGKQPPDRYMHSMTFVPKENCIAIFGGRDDYNKPNVIFNDLWVLRLNNLEWVKVEIGGQANQIERCNHCAINDGSKLIILGGQDSSFNVNKTIAVIELDQDKVDRKNPVMA